MASTQRRRGFTLLELLVVMAIVILLASFLIAALWPQKDKALRSKTAAILQAVGSALDQYFAEFHDFPPDGYDHEPNWNKTAGTYVTGGPGIFLGGGPTGTKKYRYYGSGCLIYFLCYPIANVTIVGADQGSPDPRNLRVNPCNKGGAFLTTLKKEDTTSGLLFPDDFEWSINPGMSDYGKGAGGTGGGQTWADGEIVDAYGYPIHYDKVGDANDIGPTGHFQDGLFSGKAFPYKEIHSDQKYMNEQLSGRLSPPDDGETHACPSGDTSHVPGSTGGVKHADPRVTAEADGCYIDKAGAKPRNPGGYDLWAHGKYFANGISSITNWKN
jgi:prepilin-type N-terminal cleavage/methylation domain-containing protein